MVDVRFTIPDDSLLGQDLISYKGKNSRRAQELAFMGLIVEKILFSKGGAMQALSMLAIPSRDVPRQAIKPTSSLQHDELQEKSGSIRAAQNAEGEDAVPAFYADIDLGALRIRPSSNP